MSIFAVKKDCTQDATVAYNQGVKDGKEQERFRSRERWLELREELDHSFAVARGRARGEGVAEGRRELAAELEVALSLLDRSEVLGLTPEERRALLPDEVTERLE